jgi:hypothetical protein
MAGNSRHDSEPQATDVTEVELSIRRGRSSSPALQKLDRSRTLRGLLVRELGQLLANLAQTIMVGIMVELHHLGRAIMLLSALSAQEHLISAMWLGSRVGHRSDKVGWT